ncbi:MAG TPA: hypothetical protein VMD08_14400 [Candidatus Baltobacteraceae bacterium]|nr:hypothetical protein [Candidatus Baltobacteraceae bacterium]
MRVHLAVIAVLLGICFTGSAHGQQILVLGNARFIDDAAINQSLGATVVRSAGSVQLSQVAVVVLANIALNSVPDHIRSGLSAYVGSGGALLITGGDQSFGSGGYQDLASILPFTIRTSNDWRAIPFTLPVPIQPGHPILAGVEFPTIGFVNDMNPLPAASEILQLAGRSTYPYALIAERSAGGRVVGMAFDPDRLIGYMPTLPRLAQNTLKYLLGR